jgi:hypothetical protein
MPQHFELPPEDETDVDDLYQDVPTDIIAFIAACASGPPPQRLVMGTAQRLLRRYGYRTDGTGQPVPAHTNPAAMPRDR